MHPAQYNLNATDPTSTSDGQHAPTNLPCDSESVDVITDSLPSFARIVKCATEIVIDLWVFVSKSEVRDGIDCNLEWSVSSVLIQLLENTLNCK